MKGRLGGAVAAACIAAALLSAAPAHATFPGQNGKIAFSDCGPVDCGVFVMNPDASGRTQLTHNPDKLTICDRDGCFDAFGQDAAPRWSADGRKLVFSRHPAFARDGEIHTVNADGSGLTKLTTGAGSDDDPAWSLDGHQIAFTRSDPSNPREDRLFVMDAAGSQVTQLAELAEGPDWSPDGSAIAYAVPNRNPLGLPYSFYLDIHLIAPDGSNDRQITSSAEPQLFGQQSPSWSPDGARLAVSRAVLPAPCCRHNHDIWTLNADGGGFTNLTPDTPNSDDAHPVFSPDGKKIAFWAEAIRGLNVMNADTGAAVTYLGTGFQPDWQPLVGPQRDDYKNASQFCHAERDFLGAAAFRERYGGHGKCVNAGG